MKTVPSVYTLLVTDIYLSLSTQVQLLLLYSSFLQRIERGFQYKSPQSDSVQITFFYKEGSGGEMEGWGF